MTESTVVCPLDQPMAIRSGLLSRLWKSTESFFDYLALLDQVRVERKALARLGDRDFQDMGIDRATALNESTRGYFDAPQKRLNSARLSQPAPGSEQPLIRD